MCVRFNDEVFQIHFASMAKKKDSFDSQWVGGSEQMVKSSPTPPTPHSVTSVDNLRQSNNLIKFHFFTLSSLKLGWESQMPRKRKSAWLDTTKDKLEKASGHVHSYFTISLMML